MIVANFGSEGQMLAAYFPQGKSKLPFFKRCIGEAEASYNIPFVLLGDLNTGSNGADVEGKGARFIYADEFEELQTKVGLVDLWRFEHGDRKEWTWRSRINGFRVDHALANAIFRKRNPKIRCFYDQRRAKQLLPITARSF